MRKLLFVCFILSLISYILFGAASSIEANHGVTPNTNCLGLHGTFNATNWPSNATIDIACQGDTGTSGCDGSITENQTPGAVFHFPDCSCPSYVDGCLKIGSNLSLVRRNVTYPAGSGLLDGERFMADGDYSLPNGCTLRQTLTCGTNGYDPDGVNATFTIDCPINLPTVTCEAKNAIGTTTITSINSGGTVYWTARGRGGSGTYTSYAWTGDGFSGTETTTGGSTSIKSKTYTNTGTTAVTKTASVTVTDSSNNTSADPPATCSVTVNAPTPTPTPTPVPSTPSCTLSAVSSSTVASTECTSGQTGRDVTGTITTSNITNSTISGVNWTMNGGSVLNSCSGTGCLTKFFPCVRYGTSQSLMSQVQFPGGPVSCSTIFDNPASGTPPPPEIPGSSGSFSNFRYHVDCSDNGHGNSQGFGNYNDTAYKIFTTWDWSGGGGFNHYEAWVVPSTTNAWECYMGPSTSCSYNERITGAGYSFPRLDIYREDKTTLINHAAKITANSSDEYATGQFTEFYMGVFYPARGIYKDSGWLTQGPLCPFDLVVENSNVKITSPADTNNIRVSDRLSFEGKVEEQGLGLNAPSAYTRLSVFRQTSSGPVWIWNYDQATENISHNQNRTPSWSNLAGLTSIPGNYLFRICANSNALASGEFKYDNNCGQGTYTVISLPVDLDPGDIAISPASAISPGIPVTFSVDVTNTEIGNAGSFNSRFCIDNSSCATSTTSRVGNDITTGSLAFSATTPINSTTWTATSGNHTVYFCADTDRTITETNASGTGETNNCSSKTFTVIAPYQPWIQVDGDVHSNTRIDLSGGPP